jgi:hypothetical protein
MRSLSGFAIACSFVLAPLWSTGVCQEKSAEASSPTQANIDLPSDVHITPEMWMYLHEYRRHQDPKEASRERAEFKSQQRQNRIASRRWYGHTKARPTAAAIPYFSTYGTQWVGLPWDPYRWSVYKTTYRHFQNPYPDYYHYPAYRIAGRGNR